MKILGTGIVTVAASWTLLATLSLLAHLDDRTISTLCAGTTAVMVSQVLALFRLVTHRDKTYGRSYVHCTPAACSYVALHGLAAAIPFAFHLIWAPKSDAAWLSASPWLVAVVAPLFINRLVKLQGIDVPEATGRLSRLRAEVSEYIHSLMIDQESAEMRDYVAAFAKNVSVQEVRLLAVATMPVHFAPKKKETILAAIDDARTTERAMELFIRLIGKNLFVSVFGEKVHDRKLAPTPLFEIARSA